MDVAQQVIAARRSGRRSTRRRCAPWPAPSPQVGEVDAEAGRLAEPVGERHVEHLHEDRRRRRAAPTRRTRRPGTCPSRCGRSTGPSSRRPRVALAGTPSLAWRRSTMGMNWMNSRRTRRGRSGRPPAGCSCVGLVTRVQGVDVDAVLAQQRQAAHHLVEGGLAALVRAVGVVHLARAVDAEARPGSCARRRTRAQSSSICVPLVWMVCSTVWPGCAYRSTSSIDAPEEVEAHERGLAALPGDRDLGRPVRLEELADVQLQHLVRHAESAARVQRLLGQEEAVGAVEVADRARRLGQQVERRREGVGEDGRALGAGSLRFSVQDWLLAQAGGRRRSTASV